MAGCEAVLIEELTQSKLRGYTRACDGRVARKRGVA